MAMRMVNDIFEEQQDPERLGAQLQPAPIVGIYYHNLRSKR